MFQTEAFQLHRFVPEVTRIVKTFCKNFMSTVTHDEPAIDIYDQSKWCPVDEIYPGSLAHETLGTMKPHDRASFLTCAKQVPVAIRTGNTFRPEETKALAKRLDFSLDFLLDKKSRKKSSRLATLLSESSGVEWSRVESSGVE